MTRNSLPPAISVIIPTLQEEDEILHLLTQFTPELRARHRLEIIVSDGGSTDRTREIALPHVDRFLCPPAGYPQTIAGGRNSGAEAAAGDLLIFFNADVRIGDPELFFRTMEEAFMEEPVVAATCSISVHPEEETGGDKIFHTIFNLYCRLLNAVGIGMGRGECHVVRKNVFRDVGGYRESIAAGEDFELFVRLRRKGKIAFVAGLRVFESPRRYRAMGYVRLSMLWFANAVSVLFRRRSLSRTWAPVR